MNTCDACKHWGQPDEDGQIQDTWEDKYYCPVLNDLIARGKEIDEDNPDGIGTFRTAAKFGCIHWQPA